jgi:spermidine synthase
LESRRSFYGVVRVVEERYGGETNRVGLMHGRTVQGFQVVDPVMRRKPTSYFSERSGVGLAFLHHPKRRAGGEEAPLRVGVVGLGVGTVAAYGRAGDHFRFFEINPDVIELAQGPQARFTYLADSPARIEVVPGDARLSLAAERGAPYDLLVLDAYSGDSPPVHLLTLEAFRLYRSRLAPGGLLAVNISNRYLRMSPLIFGFARELGLRAVKVDSRRVFPLAYGARWVLMGNDNAFFDSEAVRVAASPSPPADVTDRIRLWTDDYSNLLQLLR